MAEKPIGPILDGLGVSIDLPDDALVESATVIAKVIHADGSVAVALSDSVGLSWVDQLGLITAANQIVNERPYEHPDNE